MIDSRGIRHNTDTGAWDCRRSLPCCCCMGRINLTELSDMPLVCYGDEVSDVRQLYGPIRWPQGIPSEGGLYW